MAVAADLHRDFLIPEEAETPPTTAWPMICVILLFPLVYHHAAKKAIEKEIKDANQYRLLRAPTPWKNACSRKIRYRRKGATGVRL